MTDSVCILGATGSIGTSTLDVIRRNPDRYKVSVLTARSSVDKLFEQCLEFQPDLAIMEDEQSANILAKKLSDANSSTQVRAGKDSLNDAANHPGLTIVVAAIVGAAGLLPTLTAVNQGLKVLLANKEALVMSGDIFTAAVKEFGAVLLPVDSEHNAIFQSLPQADEKGNIELKGVNKILLTGSGGPFRTMPIERLVNVTPEQACAHPNWDMGKKISVDSATMMNKGLEYIEACFLFDLQPERIQIVVHPQSIVHSMVSYIDGSVIAQMGQPDMRTPIAHTLAWPERIDAGVEPLDFYQMKSLDFEEPDYVRFPCLELAKSAMETKGTAPCVLNAANEVAVDAFLNEIIRFTDIEKVIRNTLDEVNIVEASTLEVVLSADEEARSVAQKLINEKFVAEKEVS